MTTRQFGCEPRENTTSAVSKNVPCASQACRAYTSASGGIHTGGEAGTQRSGDRGAPWLVTVASLAVGCAFLAVWFWFLPSWLGFHVDMPRAAPWRWIATLPSVLGFAVALRCVWDFGRTGRGTPAPVAPPARLVVVGFYRYVRNPMYVGVLIVGAGFSAARAGSSSPRSSSAAVPCGRRRAVGDR